MRRFVAVHPLVMASSLLLHLIGHHPDYTLLDGLLAGFLSLFAIGSVVRHVSRQGEALPILSWAFLILYVYFGLPVFFPGMDSETVAFQDLKDSGAVTLALLAIVVMGGCMLAGYAGGRVFGGRMADTRLLRSAGGWSRAGIFPGVLFIYALMSVSISYLIYRYIAHPPWYFFLVKVFFSPVLCQLILLYEMKRQGGKTLRLAYISFLALSIIAALITSRLAYMIMPLVIHIVVAFGRHERINPLLLAAMILGMVLVNPLKLQYRAAAGFFDQGGEIEHSLSRSIDLWGMVFAEKWMSGGQSSPWLESLTGLSSRMNLLSTVAETFYKVPDLLDHEYGSTWMAVPYAFVPRLIWREKPDLTAITNDYYCIKFGQLSRSETDFISLSFPLATEGYWNMGWLGVVFAGGLVGFWFGLLGRWFSIPGLFSFAFCYVCLFNVKPGTGPLVDVFGSVPQKFLAVFVVIYLLTKVSNLLRRLSLGGGQGYRKGRGGIV